MKLGHVLALIGGLLVLIGSLALPWQSFELAEVTTQALMVRPTGVGIIGLGSQWESRYLPALRSLADRFEVGGICEQVAHLAQGAANALSTSTADGFRSLIARDDIDAVLYLANDWFGTTPVVAACDHGKAVYSAVSLPGQTEEARALRLLVEQSGIVFMAELPRRHAPATIRLKELIATKLGPPRMLFCHRRVPKVHITSVNKETDTTT